MEYNHKFSGALVVNHLWPLGNAVISIQGFKCQLQRCGCHRSCGSAVRIQETGSCYYGFIIGFGRPAGIIQPCRLFIKFSYISPQEQLHIAEIFL